MPSLLQKNNKNWLILTIHCLLLAGDRRQRNCKFFFSCSSWLVGTSFCLSHKCFIIPLLLCQKGLSTDTSLWQHVWESFGRYLVDSTVWHKQVLIIIKNKKFDCIFKVSYSQITLCGTHRYNLWDPKNHPEVLTQFHPNL